LLRLLLLGAAALLVMGGGLPTLHLASHRHAVCPEHGDLVDVDGSHSVGHSSHVVANHVDEDPADTGEHTHCGVLASLTQAARRTPSRLDAAAPPRLGVACRPMVRRLSAPVHALWLAPKTSPPV